MTKYLYGRNTARSWIGDEFDLVRNKVKLLLKQALSQIHISIDIWTSNYSTYAMLGVNAHFVARVGEGESELRAFSTLLALRRLKERHTGEYQASILADVVKDYEFSDNLGVCVTDNASDNGTAVRSLFAALSPELKDLTGRRVRCLAHIVNLAAKAFLYKTKADAFIEEARRLENEEFDLVALQTAQQVWRKQGPLGKLHNLVVFVRSSATRQEEFAAIKIGDAIVDGKWPDEFLNLRSIKLQLI